jgi:uncharacterized protein VirK/YbjX
VADDNHPQRRVVTDVRLSYDEVWLERGGVNRGDGFFSIPLAKSRRLPDAIPAKKRAMYSARYMMLDEIESELITKLKPKASHRPARAIGDQPC